MKSINSNQSLEDHIIENIKLKKLKEAISFKSSTRKRKVKDDIKTKVEEKNEDFSTKSRKTRYYGLQ